MAAVVNTDNAAHRNSAAWMNFSCRRETRWLAHAGILTFVMWKWLRSDGFDYLIAASYASMLALSCSSLKPT